MSALIQALANIDKYAAVASVVFDDHRPKGLCSCELCGKPSEVTPSVRVALIEVATDAPGYGRPVHLGGGWMRMCRMCAVELGDE